jgi:hypothetical protein
LQNLPKDKDKEQQAFYKATLHHAIAKLKQAKETSGK